MKAILYFAAVIISLNILGCTSDKSQKESQKEKSSVRKTITEKQLNITILLDLSDRIKPTKYPSKPEHYERDIEIINYFTELFKRDMETKGAFKANGKMKVIFSPRPQDDEINTIASKLKIDLSKAKNTKEKKDIFDNVSVTFRDNLERIYAKTIEIDKYPGSDIWRFFKNDVVDYCIDTDPNYRNILVLITDGYIYHSDSRDKEKTRSAYLLPELVKSNGLRSSNWKEKFDNGDYGYITKRSDLTNLDLLVLEINPSPSHKNDEDVIKAYLTKWFAEMKVNTFKLYNSDLPEYTKTRIEKFVIK